MEWQNVYEERKTNAGAAIRRIAPGGRIVLAHAAGVPIALTDELVRQKEHFKHAEIVQLVPMETPGLQMRTWKGISGSMHFFWVRIQKLP